MKTQRIGILFMMIGAMAFGQTSELANLTNVPALIPEYDPPVDGSSPSETLHFDKLVLITAESPSGLETQIHLYINTNNGDFATITGKAGNNEDGSFNIDDPNFRLTYFNPRGRIYNFYTRKKNGSIERYMSSMNTEIVAYSSGIPFQRTTIYRIGNATNPLPQRFDAASFKASGSNAPTLVFCGGKPGSKPEKLLLKRFIGYSGIGYAKTDEGIYMAVKAKSDQGSFTATKWKNERYKINISDFKHIESEMYEDMFAKNAEKTAKLESKTFTGNCADIKTLINELKIEQKKKEKQNIEDMGKGNPMTDTNVRNAMKGMYGDPVEQLKIADLEVDLKLCNLESKRIKTTFDDKKKACLLEEKARINKASTELQALKQRYSRPNDPPIIMTPEFREIERRRATTSSNCNQN